MATRITDSRQLPAFALTYVDWLAVLDALETDASTHQRDDAQDLLQHRAPYSWLAAVEERDTRP